jgi:hypothetical protein
MLYLFFNFSGETLTSNNIMFGVVSVFMSYINQSASRLPVLFITKYIAKQELSSDWSIYLSVLHMIGQSKINERLHDMIPNLNVTVLPEKIFFLKR